MGDSNSQQQDPYDFLFSHSQITSSQEQLLRDLSLGPHSQHSPSPSTPPASAHSPDTVPQDAFHTPPENISLPSFCDQPRAATEGHVDLGMDSGLGLSEMSIGEYSHGARRDALSEMDEGPVKKLKLSEGDLGIDSSGGCVEVQSQKVEEEKNSEGVGNSEGNLVSEEEKVLDVFDVFRVLTEISDEEGESLDSFSLSEVAEARGITFPRPKWWPEGENLGIDSYGGCVEVQSQKVEEEGVGNSEGNLVSGEEKISDENNCSAENLETIVGNVGLCESEKAACTIEGSRSRDGVVEDSEMGKKNAAMGKKNAASGMEFGNIQEKMNVFDVFRFLSEISNEEGQNLDNISLSEVAEACGLTFPRPRWWPEGENFESEGENFDLEE